MKKLLLITLSLILFISLMAAKTNKPTEKPQAHPLITFIDLGSTTCQPCKMMVPVMKEIEKKYPDKVKVLFYDTVKQREMANKFNIRLIPTQVFLDVKGKEFWRHEGFYPASDIEKVIDKKLGLKSTKDTSTNTQEQEKGQTCP